MGDTIHRVTDRPSTTRRSNYAAASADGTSGCRSILYHHKGTTHRARGNCHRAHRGARKYVVGAEDKRSARSCGGGLQVRRTSAGSEPVVFLHIEVTSITQGDSILLEPTAGEIERQAARSIAVDGISSGYVVRKNLGSGSHSFHAVFDGRRDVFVTVGRDHSALDEEI